MKHLFFTLSLVFLLFSCNNGEKNAENATKRKLEDGFKIYIRNNDIKKGYNTELKSVQIVSFEKEVDAESNTAYKARIHFTGTTSESGSTLMYNMDETVLGIFDKEYKMTEMIKNLDTVE